MTLLRISAFSIHRVFGNRRSEFSLQADSYPRPHAEAFMLSTRHLLDSRFGVGANSKLLATRQSKVFSATA